MVARCARLIRNKDARKRGFKVKRTLATGTAMNDAIATSGIPAAEQLLAIVQQLAGQAHPGHSYAITLHTSFERDLGLDSLARVELMQRVGKAFGVELPGEALSQADTPLELLRFLGQAPQSLATEALATLSGTHAAGQPGGAQTLLDVPTSQTASISCCMTNSIWNTPSATVTCSTWRSPLPAAWRHTDSSPGKPWR